MGWSEGGFPLPSLDKGYKNKKYFYYETQETLADN